MKACRRCAAPFTPSQRHHYLCFDCWCLDRRGHSAPISTTALTLGVDAELIRAAVLLCHPDRHPVERQEAATATTARLLGVLRRLQGCAA